MPALPRASRTQKERLLAAEEARVAHYVEHFRLAVDDDTDRGARARGRGERTCYVFNANSRDGLDEGLWFTWPTDAEGGSRHLSKSIAHCCIEDVAAIRPVARNTRPSDGRSERPESQTPMVDVAWGIGGAIGRGIGGS